MYVYVYLNAINKGRSDNEGNPDTLATLMLYCVTQEITLGW
ncbi:hypothetical protein DEAC_c14620 [Desulfosporosinus acididurans]|uniref:Uncharacterized protein n=1 Tax=Desulfosporosinus acididurans TaxID=476652 RepID=A0A0J1FTJ3_9FIRM|nr:hypothetical protein DEAC_c14620 [Desulfosporosinus acididurans]